MRTITLIILHCSATRENQRYTAEDCKRDHMKRPHFKDIGYHFYIERDGKVFIPSGDFIIRAKDIISFAASQRESRQFLKKIGFKTGQVKTCMIVGGGKICYYLSRQLLAMGMRVKIIEQDYKRCTEIKADYYANLAGILRLFKLERSTYSIAVTQS